MGENVKDLLKEMKNVSSLMLDLAYSSLFLKNKDVAEEVMLLYKEVQDVEERLYLHLFAAARGKSATRLIGLIDVVEAVKDVSIAAKHMSEMVLDGTHVDPIVKEAIGESDDSIQRSTISSKSILNKKSLGELKLRTETGFDVLAIRRGSRWLWDPKTHINLRSGDVVIGVGSTISCEKFKGLASGSLKEI